MVRRKGKTLASAGIRNPDIPVRSLLTTSTELPQKEEKYLET